MVGRFDLQRNMRSSPSPRVPLPLSLAILFVLASNHRPRSAAVALSASSSSNAPKPPRRYNYFAFGSNMCSATMTDLRNLRPVAATAAVLPDHELRFNVPGMPLVEPSWASVEPVVPVERRRKRSTESASESKDVVHGVLYSLTEEDFEAVCRTEGVPFAYTLHRCRVVPYTGNGRDAGARALEGSSTAESKRIPTIPKGIPAYTLRAGNKSLRSQPRSADAPPSRGYVNVLLRGAREFFLDGDYVQSLEDIPTGRTIGGDGTAERLLDAAIQRKGGGDRR